MARLQLGIRAGLDIVIQGCCPLYICRAQQKGLTHTPLAACIACSLAHPREG